MNIFICKKIKAKNQLMDYNIKVTLSLANLGNFRLLDHWLG